MGNRALAALAVLTLLAGCFGYNKSAKRWSYVGNTVLILGGAGAITADVMSEETQPDLDRDGMADCEEMNRRCPYQSPVGGMMVAGVMLVAAGIIGIVINATRPEVKTSR